jgi:phosphoglycerate dehydrogenase-like enzyme
MSRALDTIAVLMPLPAKALEKVRSAFKTVHYAPSGPDVPAKRLPAEVWKDVEVLFCDWTGPPKDLELSEVPNLRHVQLPTAGVDGALANSKLVQELAARDPSASSEGPTVSSASGIHVFTIPNWVVGMTIALSQQHHVMARFARVSEHWAEREAR